MNTFYFIVSIVKGRQRYFNTLCLLIYRVVRKFAITFAVEFPSCN